MARARQRCRFAVRPKGPGALAYGAPSPRVRRPAVSTIGQGSTGRGVLANGQANPRGLRHARRARTVVQRARLARQSVPSWACAMTSTSEVLAALPPFQVMSRLDLKAVAGGFKDSWKLGKGLRCVAPAVRHTHLRMFSRRPLPFLAERDVSRRLDHEHFLPARPLRTRSNARRNGHVVRPSENRGISSLLARDLRRTRR